MPDIWTKHPEIIRRVLEEAGFQCGVTPKILTTRKPQETCRFEKEGLVAEFYVHPVPSWMLSALLLGLAVILVGFLWWLTTQKKTRVPTPR